MRDLRKVAKPTKHNWKMWVTIGNDLIDEYEEILGLSEPEIDDTGYRDKIRDSIISVKDMFALLEAESAFKKRQKRKDLNNRWNYWKKVILKAYKDVPGPAKDAYKNIIRRRDKIYFAATDSSDPALGGSSGFDFGTKSTGTFTGNADDVEKVTSKKDKKSPNWYDKLDPSSKKGKIPVAKISWDGKKVEVPTADNYKDWLKRGQKILDKLFFKAMDSSKKTESQQSIKDLLYLLEAEGEEDLQKLWDKYWFTMSKYAKTLPKEAQDEFMRQIDAKEKFERKLNVAGIKSGPYDDNRDFGRDKIDAERRKEYGAFTEIIQDFKGNPSLDNFKKAIEQAKEIDVSGKFYTDMRKLGQFYGMVAKALGLRGLIHFEEGTFQNQQVSFAATQENDFSKSNEEIAPQGMHTTQDANPEKHKDIAQAQFNKGLLPPELAEKFGVDMQAVSGQGSGEKLGTTDRVKKEGFPQPYIVKKGNVAQFGEEGFGAFTKQKFRPAEAWHKDNPKRKHKSILDFSVKGKVFLIIPGKNGHYKFEAEKDDSSTTWYKKYGTVTDERYDRAFKAMGIGVEQDPADSEWNRPRPNPDLASYAQQPKPDLDKIEPGSKASKELTKLFDHLGLGKPGGTNTDALNTYFEAKTGTKLPSLSGNNLKEIIDFSQKRGTQGYFRVFELLKNHANKNESMNRLLTLSGMLTEEEDVKEYHAFVSRIIRFLTGENNLPYLEDFPYMANLLRSEKTYFEKQGKARLIQAGLMDDPNKVKPATDQPTADKPDQSIQGQMQIKVSADKRYIGIPTSEKLPIAKKINAATWGSGWSTIDRQVKDGKIYSRASVEKESPEVAPSGKVKIIDKRGNPGLYDETISWMKSVGYPPIAPGQAVTPPAEQPAQTPAAEPIQTSIKQQKHPFTGKTSFVIMKTDPKTGKQKRASQEEFPSQEKAKAFLQNWQLGPTGWQRKAGAKMQIQRSSVDNSNKEDKMLKEASMNISMTGNNSHEVQELMAILKNAGMDTAHLVTDTDINQPMGMEEPHMCPACAAAHSMDSPCGEAVEEEYVNSPDEEYQDDSYMIQDLSGGLNRKKERAAQRVKDPAVAYESKLKNHLRGQLQEMYQQLAETDPFAELDRAIASDDMESDLERQERLARLKMMQKKRSKADAAHDELSKKMKEASPNSLMKQMKQKTGTGMGGKQHSQYKQFANKQPMKIGPAKAPGAKGISGAMAQGPKTAAAPKTASAPKTSAAPKATLSPDTHAMLKSVFPKHYAPERAKAMYDMLQQKTGDAMSWLRKKTGKL